jgi:hypothetical protein
MSLTKLSLGGNDLYMTSLFPPRESLVGDIPAGDGAMKKLFLHCTMQLCFHFKYRHLHIFFKSPPPPQFTSRSEILMCKIPRSKKCPEILPPLSSEETWIINKAQGSLRQTSDEGGKVAVYPLSPSWICRRRPQHLVIKEAGAAPFSCRLPRPPLQKTRPLPCNRINNPGRMHNKH